MRSLPSRAAALTRSLVSAARTSGAEIHGRSACRVDPHQRPMQSGELANHVGIVAQFGCVWTVDLMDRAVGSVGIFLNLEWICEQEYWRLESRYQTFLDRPLPRLHAAKLNSGRNRYDRVLRRQKSLSLANIVVDQKPIHCSTVY